MSAFDGVTSIVLSADCFAAADADEDVVADEDADEEPDDSAELAELVCAGAEHAVNKSVAIDNARIATGTVCLMVCLLSTGHAPHCIVPS